MPQLTTFRWAFPFELQSNISRNDCDTRQRVPARDDEFPLTKSIP